MIIITVKQRWQIPEGLDINYKQQASFPQTTNIMGLKGWMVLVQEHVTLNRWIHTFRWSSLICSKNCWSCTIIYPMKLLLKWNPIGVGSRLIAIPLFEAPCEDQLQGSSPTAVVLQHSIPQAPRLSSAYK